MRKNDFVLLGFFLAIALLGTVYIFIAGKESGGTVKISVDGRAWGNYDLSADQTVDIKGTNILEIRDGKASMKTAGCPDQICVHQKPISKNGESIICLPNRVVVTIDSENEASLDAVSG
ncbi:NusG domain II-containing protein [Luxibacter massiliensis]|uniref:NusG domain II-containing protein n=1 Tax=Luxibacter massiliensis TaxID=2219695 RepID=UPI000F068812|nr:NusG domain II-containing protein [Luxibacter massiliensis]